MVDERREAALADSYDYYYVPSYYVNGKKLHEGHAEKADVEAVYRAALGETGWRVKKWAHCKPDVLQRALFDRRFGISKGPF